MFERGTGDKGDGTGAVEITLDDGQKLQGKFLPPGRALAEILNSSTPFVEFLPTGADRMYVAKKAVQCVKPMTAAPSAPKLATGNGDAAGSNPSAILHVAADANREEVHEAYVHLAKIYHPDRYAAVDLPPEVKEYLEAMARRINAAHDALEASHKHAAKEEPVFTKPGRGR
jgi:DnaJ domain